MTTQTLQSAGPATMPRVNLMPPEIAEAERFRQLQIALGGAVLAAVALVGVMYWHAHSGVSSARQQFAQQQAQNATLQQQLTSLNSVAATFAAVQARQGLLAQAMGQEVRWSFLLNDLSLRMPNNVWLTSMQVGEGTSTASGTPAAPATLTPTAAAPAAPVPIGSITFAGVAFKHDDVAAWLDAMAKVKSFSDPTFTSSTEAVLGGHNVVDFGGSVTLLSTALSNRYTAPASPATTPGAVTP